MIIDYQKLCEDIFQDLATRKRDVLERRFGLLGQDHQNLQAIGDELGITRERVRQIENDAFGWVLENRSAKLQKPFQYFLDYFDEHGGLREEQKLLNDLGEDRFQNYVFLILNLGDNFYKFKETEEFYPFWLVDNKRVQDAQRVLQRIIKEFERARALMELEELGQRITFNLPTPVLVSYIDISKNIFQSPFGAYGLAHWPEVNPRGLKDKAYFVLKKEGRPLHFTEIAQLIGKLPQVSHRVLPESVHNELIRNERFVLVGRGIYALAEWGYQPGTVKDILKDILEESKTPLSREELVKRVLEQREVKESTVALNLQDKKVFRRDKKGRYSLLKK